jgi:putative ABC transport system substrate-binding protein
MTGEPMQRREFITLLSGAAAAWPLTAKAQQRTMPVVGYLHSSSPEPFAYQVDAFRKGLSETGYVEGRNVGIEFRWADNDHDRLREMAADLVRRRVNVIATPGGVPATRAAMGATASIPIVFMYAGDPVQAGFVMSLKRPGGNTTGVSFMLARSPPSISDSCANFFLKRDDLPCSSIRPIQFLSL